LEKNNPFSDNAICNSNIHPILRVQGGVLAQAGAMVGVRRAVEGLGFNPFWKDQNSSNENLPVIQLIQ